MDRQRQVGRYGPRSRGPDNYVAVLRLFREATKHSVRVFIHREADEHAVGRMVAVFDCRVGKGRLATRAPEYRLQAAVYVALLSKIAEDFDDFSLEVRAHGKVRVVPIASHAKPLELRLLFLDKAGSILPAPL